MARMVDVDALTKAMGVHTYMQTEWTPATAWGVPIVDAVEVVRCKDCIHYWKNKPSDDVPVCLASPKDDAFCSEGERKEDGKIDRC